MGKTAHEEWRESLTPDLLMRTFRVRIRGYEVKVLIELLHEKVESLQPNISELRDRYYKAANPLRAELKQQLMAARRELWMYVGWRDRFRRLLSGKLGKCQDGCFARRVARNLVIDSAPNTSERLP